MVELSPLTRGFADDVQAHLRWQPRRAAGAASGDA